MSDVEKKEGLLARLFVAIVKRGRKDARGKILRGGEAYGEKWWERQQPGRGRIVRPISGPSYRAKRLHANARIRSKGDKGARRALLRGQGKGRDS